MFHWLELNERVNEVRRVLFQDIAIRLMADDFKNWPSYIIYVAM